MYLINKIITFEGFLLVSIRHAIIKHNTLNKFKVLYLHIYIYILFVVIKFYVYLVNIIFGFRFISLIT